jgi:AcrR family transcriptional regulator
MKKKDYAINLIVEKATELFNLRGYWGVSMADISAACGFSKASIYHYFKTKDSLAAACVEAACKGFPLSSLYPFPPDLEKFKENSGMLISFSLQLTKSDAPLTVESFMSFYSNIFYAIEGLLLQQFLTGINK